MFYIPIPHVWSGGGSIAKIVPGRPYIIQIYAGVLFYMYRWAMYVCMHACMYVYAHIFVCLCIFVYVSHTHSYAL